MIEGSPSTKGRKESIMEADKMQEREVFIAKGLNKMKKVHVSTKLIEIIFIVISEFIKELRFSLSPKKTGKVKESKKTRWEAE